MKLITAPFLISMLALAACSDDSTQTSSITIPSAPIAINASNAESVATEAIETRESMTSLGDSSSVVVTGVQMSAQPPGGLIQATIESFRHAYLAPVTDGSTVAGVVTTPDNNIGCTSGTANVTFSDVNLNNQWDQGESATIRYTNCAVVLNNVTISLNGRIAITLAELTGDPATGSSGADWSFRIAVVYSDYTLSIGNIAVSFAGDVAVEAGYANPTLSASLNGSSLTRTISTPNKTFAARLSSFDFDVTNTIATNTYSWNADYNLASSSLNGSISVLTGPNPPAEPIFSGINGMHPTQGVLLITGANDSAIKLDANTGDDNTVGIWLDEDGDGIFMHLVDVAWAN